MRLYILFLHKDEGGGNILNSIVDLARKLMDKERIAPITVEDCFLPDGELLDRRLKERVSTLKI